MTQRNGVTKRSRSSAALCALALAAVAGCAAEPIGVNDDSLKGTRFIRYTLRGEKAGTYTQAWRSNYLSQPAFREVGSKVEIDFYSNQYVGLNFNGIRARVYSRDEPYHTDPESIKAFVDKHFVASPEDLKLEALEKTIRDQVKRGQALIGMPKEQVLMALGYPSHVDDYVQAASLTRDQILSSNVWIYRYSEIMMFTTWHRYTFDNDGKLAERIP